MRQINSISKKNRRRHILIFCVCIFTLTSCYDFDPLPDRIRSNYEFAIPLIDTTVKVGDFADFVYYGVIPDTLTVPRETSISMGEHEYPFFIGDYSSSQEIEWLEPQIIIDTKDFPSGTVINIRIYTKNDNGEKIYFWLPENHSVTLVNTPVKVPDAPTRIKEISQFRTAQKVYLDVLITYPTEVPVTQIINDRVNIKFGIKFAIKTDLTIKL